MIRLLAHERWAAWFFCALTPPLVGAYVWWLSDTYAATCGIAAGACVFASEVACWLLALDHSNTRVTRSAERVLRRELR